MKRVIFENEDGGVSVITPSPDALQTMTIEQIAQKDVPSGVTFDIVDTDELPNDRYFRNAWRKNGKTIDIDMSKARDIQMDVIRTKRNAKLVKQDLEWQRETEQGNTIKAKNVVKLKQTLRDLPNTFDLTVATTPEALKLMMPEELID